MQIKAGLSRVQDLDIERLTSEATSAGFKVFVLKPGIDTRESFFESIREAIPLDPPIVGTQSWDALSDSLWGGLYSVDQDRILIVWPKSTAMAAMSQEDHQIAIDVLNDVVTSLADRESTQERPKSVTVLLGS